MFSDRVQVVKMAEEPSSLISATPPFCEQKKRRGRKGREREEERNRHRREKKSTRKIMSGCLLCGRHLSKIKKIG